MVFVNQCVQLSLLRCDPLNLKQKDNTGANTGNTHADPNDPHADSGRDFTFTNLKVYNFRQYANVMQPVNRTPPAIGLSWQIRLYGDLMDI